MRLTNITRVALPEGTLHVLRSRAGSTGSDLPISFDQRRHIGEGDRAGSWMALAFDAPEGTDLVHLADAWGRVIRRHGALHTVFESDGHTLRLRAVETAPTSWELVPVPVGHSIREELHALLDAGCRPFARPAHLLAAVVPDQGPTTVIVASDHSHVDMWSLLVLARDLLADTPAAVRPADFAAHSAALEAMPPAPDAVVERWRAILDAGDGVLPVFPLPLGDISVPRREVVEVRDILDADDAVHFEAVASRHGVRPTALALAALTETTLALAGTPLRAVFPVHSRNERRWHDSVGWFITNSVIECADPDPAACAVSLKESLTLGSHPLAPILGREGAPANPGMFAISWLDTRRLPDVGSARRIQFVSAEIATDGVMVWFILNDSGMHLRCRYPDTAEARENVGRWLDAVEASLRSRARARVEAPLA